MTADDLVVGLADSRLRCQVTTRANGEHLGTVQRQPMRSRSVWVAFGPDGRKVGGPQRTQRAAVALLVGVDR